MVLCNFIILFALFFCDVQSANVLCVFPTPVISHQLVFGAYVDKLAAAGHNVTVITSVPRNLNNIIEINCASTVHRQFDILLNRSSVFKKKGLVADELSVTADNYTPLVDIIMSQFQNNNVTDFLTNNKNYFDVVVVEAYMELNLVYGYLYNAPVILFSSGYATNSNFRLMNNHITYNHFAYPNVWRSSFHQNPLDITITEQRLEKEWLILEYIQDNRLKRLFNDKSVPVIEKLKKSVQMMFINVPHIFDNNRPVGANVHYLGGLHLKKPQDIQDQQLISFFNRYNVVVYASFGSIVNMNFMTDDLVTSFVNVFNNVTYGVLWKNNIKRVKKNVGRNVIINDWFPQRDILNHPKVKVFISQCGVQSVDEAIDSIVPLICIPLVGDQFNHAHKIKNFGVGVTLNLLKLHEKQLRDTIVSVVTNDTYINNMYHLNRYIHNSNVITNPLNRAVIYTNKLLIQKKNKFFGNK
ncbi:egt [Psilogramma increta granulovirus]|uniref:Ecdysteroid UDP-glucosyltransferase n=1 Tax=Psilogramma increta granulovirus TaxID=2953508 RepID=A0A977XU79_9BBAC|nr:egt [Psilogramma increta granulovirus]